MKYSVEELQFANSVRTLAMQLRNEALTAIADLPSREQWKAAHPMEDFIPAAVRELEKVAAITNSI